MSQLFEQLAEITKPEVARREIKFRGKSVNTGEWHKSMTISYGTVKRKRDDLFMEIGEEKWVGIDSKTLGQFIGIRDKNEFEVYEGDIVSAYGGECHNGVYELNIIGEFVYLNTTFSILSKGVHYDFGFCPIDHIKVIGNIHEHQYLLQ